MTAELRVLTRAGALVLGEARDDAPACVACDDRRAQVVITVELDGRPPDDLAAVPLCGECIAAAAAFYVGRKAVDRGLVTVEELGAELEHRQTPPPPAAGAAAAAIALKPRYYVDRIRDGEVEPLVNDAELRARRGTRRVTAADVARASADVLSDELATLEAGDPRRRDLEDQRDAWLERARTLEAQAEAARGTVVIFAEEPPPRENLGPRLIAERAAESVRNRHANRLEPFPDRPPR